MTGVCPACERPGLRPLLRRTAVPVHQNLLVSSREEARAFPRGNLELDSCILCGFVSNTAFRPELLSYGSGYDATQTASPCFDAYVDALVDRLIEEGVTGKRIVEIGCGKGLFLKRLCARGNNTGVGFDPSYDGVELDVGGRVRFVKAFYGSSHAVEADVVVCRHVIEHVPDPVALLRDIRAGLDASAGAMVYFETPSLEWILESFVVWDFFYEHCSYFTEVALRNVFREAGFTPLAVRRSFGDQYLWIEAVLARQPEPLEMPPDGFADLLDRYAREEASQMLKWRTRAQELARRGRLAVWGAGAKGVTFVNLVDPEASLIHSLIDISPAKDGRFVPGTGHPIVSPRAAIFHSLSDAIVMNPNYLDEARRMAEEAGLTLRLHSAE